MNRRNRKLDKYKDEYDIDKKIENSNIVISFKDTCEKNCLLEEWRNKSDLRKLNNCFKTICSLDWTSIRQYNGFHFGPIPNNQLKKQLPSQVSKEETIYELRIGEDSPKRLFGYRNKNIFYIIWFDLNHQVVPYRKNVKK